MNIIKNINKDSEKKHLKDIKMFLKKKKKKGASIIRNVSRSYLSIENIIIYHIEVDDWVT